MNETKYFRKLEVDPEHCPYMLDSSSKSFSKDIDWGTVHFTDVENNELIFEGDNLTQIGGKFVWMWLITEPVVLLHYNKKDTEE